MSVDPSRDLADAAARWGVEDLLAALAEGDAAAPPRGARGRLLARIAESPRAATEALGSTDLYARRVAALAELLAGLDAREWSRVAAPYEWTVHGLVAHLLAIETYTAAQLGLCPPPDGDLDDHLRVGEDLIVAELADEPAATARRWAQRARSIVDHVGSPGLDPHRPLPLHGWPFDASSALVARAFEIWTHTDDVCRAVGRTAPLPAPGELRTMSSLSVGSLPFLLDLAGDRPPLAPVRVVLTGPGGGTHDLGGPGTRAALLVADVVDYCRVVARRLDPIDLDRSVEGDADLVDALLDVSRAFAV
jgi:uncharacterized protein (TIGR03083 family)